MTLEITIVSDLDSLMGFGQVGALKEKEDHNLSWAIAIL